MKGILFKPESIQAIIEGRKTQTRRLGGLKYINKDPNKWDDVQMMSWRGWTFKSVEGNRLAKPLYEVGETVYIKEAYQVRGGDYSTQTAWIVYPDGIELKRKIPMYYSWDKATKPCYTKLDGSMPTVSPLFMPEWAARHFITITDVRAERLQDISIKDYQAEGVQLPSEKVGSIRMMYNEAFENLWNSINKDYPWEMNPWVFPYTFRLEVK